MDKSQIQAAISDVLDGNTDSYSLLIDRFHIGLIQHLYNILNDEQAAEDIAQEAFIKAYQNLKQYNEAYAFSTWLYKIADNLAFRYMRKNSKYYGSEIDEEDIVDNSPSPSDLAELSLTKDSIRVAINKLPVNYRFVISMYYWDGLSYIEMAERLNRPEGTIKTWLNRAKDQLRKELYGQVR